MKIIQLILGKGNPERMNGVNKVVHSLACTLHKHQVDVEVWGITPQKITGQQHSTPFKILLFDTQPNHYQLDTQLKEKIKQCSKETVFHLHGAFIPEFYSVSKLLKKQGIPSILTPHGSYNKYALLKSQYKKLLYYIGFEKRLINNVNYIHLLGRNEQSYITHFTAKDKLIVIPNGQHLDKTPEMAHKSSSEFIFGFMGRIDIRHKGLDFMLKGFSIYIHQHKGDGQLYLLGDGDDMPEVKRLIKELNIENQCHVYGSVFGQKKIDLMKQFDVFLHTSRYEGVPMSVLESALMGIPCIVSEATNVKEEVESFEAGIGLTNTEPETIAKAMFKMQELKESHKIKQMKKNAINMVNEVYDWEKIVQQFVQYYSSLI